MNKMEIFVLLLFCILCYASATKNIVVSTEYGDVRGVQTNKSQFFLGIPFAKPPIGQNRWVPPSEPSPWKPNVYDATTYKPACPQKYCTKYLPNISCPIETSEDCLYLNVWTPLNATSTSGYPVMVFIHGGAFKWGSGNNYVYNGENLAQTGEVIVVNMDYRIGLLGFLYTGDEPDDAHGNFGIQDQRLALQWVQQNIRSFGGDPKKVILFGQSAGAQSTFAHMMSNLSEGLFRGVIVESAPFAVPYRYKSEALLLSFKVKQYLKCQDGNFMECLRNKTSEEINEAQEKITHEITAGKVNEYYEPVGPIVDGVDIATQPMFAAAKGYFQKIPMMVGTVTEEGRMFVYGVWKFKLTKVEYESALAAIHPEHFEDIEKVYSPQSGLPDYKDNLCVVVTDFLFTCATRNTTLNVVNNNDASVFRYVFDHATAAHGGWGKDSYCEGHVCHAEELGFVFGNHAAGKPTADETRLSESLMMYWTNFAYSLDPNDGRRSPALIWPAYRFNTTSTMYFQTPQNKLLNDYRVEYCEVWDRVGYEQ